MRRDSDAAYRLQGWRNVLNARNELTDAVARVRLAYSARAAALRDARRVKDREIIEEMHDLMSVIANANARGYQESKELVSAAHGILRRERQTAGLTADMADEVKQIFASRSARAPTGTRAAHGAIGDRALSATSSALDTAAFVQTWADSATAMSDQGWTTDVEGLGVSLAAPYIETLFSTVWSRIDEHLQGGSQWRRTAVDVLGRVQNGVGAALTLGQTVNWCAVNVPESIQGGLTAFSDPGKAVLNAVTVKLVGQGLQHATGAAVPFSKLVQPLASMANLLRQYPKIDAMHALHQRLSRTSACRDAAFQIVDKWENDLVNQVGGGNQVFAFLTAMKSICNAGDGHAVANPASTLLAAARGELGTQPDRHDAFLILATLCGAGHGRRGVDKAVAAIVSGASGAEKITSLI